MECNFLCNGAKISSFNANVGAQMIVDTLCIHAIMIAISSAFKFY